MADVDRQADQQDRATLLAPLFHKACALLLRGVEGMGDAAIRQALAGMAEDPEERIGCELAGGVSAWDAYQSGGPLEAQFAELLVGREVSCPPDGIAAMLRVLSDAGRCRVEATDPRAGSASFALDYPCWLKKSARPGPGATAFTHLIS